MSENFLQEGGRVVKVLAVIPDSKLTKEEAVNGIRVCAKFVCGTSGNGVAIEVPFGWRKHFLSVCQIKLSNTIRIYFHNLLCLYRNVAIKHKYSAIVGTLHTYVYILLFLI